MKSRKIHWSTPPFCSTLIFPRCGHGAAAAAAIVVLVGGLGIWLLARGRPAQQFENFATEIHLRYAKKAMPLDVVSSDPRIVSDWLGARLPFHVELPNYPSAPRQEKPYVLVGARLLQYLNDDIGYLAYEMKGRPISLLMASSPATAPDGGEIYNSGKLRFHISYNRGLRTMSWTDAGLNYCLISESGAGGSESCVICHGSAAERQKFQELTPERGHR